MTTVIDDKWSKIDEDCMEHAFDRAYERYFVCLDEDDIFNMIEMIQRGEAKYVRIDYPCNSVWIVDYEGTMFKTVYNGREKRICTFLPFD